MQNAASAAAAMHFDFSTIVSFILIFGFFGGLASYFAFCVYGTDGAFRDKFHIKLGPAFLFTTLSGIIGIAGAFAIQVLLLGMRFYDKNPEPQPSDFIYLAAICVIGGFAARSFLNQVSQMFARQIKQEIEETKQKIEETKQLAERTTDSSEEQARQIIMLASMSNNSDPKSLEFVVKAAESALKKNPDDGALAIAKGAALKRLNKIQEAIDTLTPYIQKHSSDSEGDRYNISTAFYNRACYNALLNRPDQALDDLKHSLELSENISGDKRLAAADSDFAGLNCDPRFIQLIKP
jgi:tetratricopeptide (TPR) repeat protein